MQMNAVLLEQRDSGPVVSYVTDRPVPVPGPGEVLVKVHAAGLNYREIMMSHQPNPYAPKQMIAGGDAAGVVAALGAGVTGWKEGDAVVVDAGISCGECRFCRAGLTRECDRYQALGYNVDGTFAEYVKVPAVNLSSLPTHLSFIEAAALPIAYGTAWDVLFTKAELKPGETVLIPGVGGGVSLFALQLAARIGARAIVTSSSDEKLARARELGAAGTINYKRENVLERVRELTGGEMADVAIDGIGKETLVTAFQATHRAGRVVRYGSITGGLDLPSRYLSKTFKMGNMASRSGWAEAMRFLNATGLRPVVDKTFAVADFAAAYQYQEAQQQFGKVVLTVA